MLCQTFPSLIRFVFLSGPWMCRILRLHLQKLFSLSSSSSLRSPQMHLRRLLPPRRCVSIHWMLLHAPWGRIAGGGTGGTGGGVIFLLRPHLLLLRTRCYGSRRRPTDDDNDEGGEGDALSLDLPSSSSPLSSLSLSHSP